MSNPSTHPQIDLPLQALLVIQYKIHSHMRFIASKMESYTHSTEGKASILRDFEKGRKQLVDLTVLTENMYPTRETVVVRKQLESLRRTLEEAIWKVGLSVG